MAPTRTSTSHEQKHKPNHTQNAESDQMVPFPPEIQEPTAQTNVCDNISSVLSPLDDSQDQSSQQIA